MTGPFSCQYLESKKSNIQQEVHQRVDNVQFHINDIVWAGLLMLGLMSVPRYLYYFLS